MSTVAGERVGFECKAYRNSGTEAAPVWEEMKRVKDLSAGMAKGEADISRRESKFRLLKGALLEWELSFGYQYTKNPDPIFDALLDSYINGTLFPIAAMDGDITEGGRQGPRFGAEVFDFPFTQNLEDSQTFEVTLKPTAYEEPVGTLIEPTWYIVPTS